MDCAILQLGLFACDVPVLEIQFDDFGSYQRMTTSVVPRPPLQQRVPMFRS